jgi:hypothetical protein
MFIASVAHEVNRAYCQAIGDDSQKPWGETGIELRDSAAKGVAFAVKNPDATPEDQHNAWMADKLRSGWTYGPEKDLEMKRHPCLVPYAELPLEQRVKDYLFRAVVRSVLEASDMPAFNPVAFKFSMGDPVSLKVSGEVGQVIGRAHFAASENSYFVRYCGADGRAVEAWWGESALDLHLPY